MRSGLVGSTPNLTYSLFPEEIFSKSSSCPIMVSVPVSNMFFSIKRKSFIEDCVYEDERRIDFLERIFNEYDINNKKLKFPLIIKPVSGGSSYGLKKVNNKKSLSEYLNL